MAFNKKKDSEKELDIEKIYADVIDYIVMQDSNLLFGFEKNERKKEMLKSKIQNIIWEQKLSIETENVYEYVSEMMSGYGPLDELIEDMNISDIKVYGSDQIRIKKLGKRYSTDVHFKSADEYIRFTKLSAIKNEIPLSDLNAMQTFTDKETSKDFILRINITTGIINSSGTPCMQMRKIPKEKRTMDDLEHLKMFDTETKDYLINAAKNSGGILFTGKGASGKTTLMNAMLEYIPEDKSCLVIQENEELFTHKHPDMMFQHIVTGRGEGRVNYQLEDLARNGLLIDLDYFVIGEIKGEEAAHLAIASFTGHQAWASVHGKSCKEAVFKLGDYIKQATDYSLDECIKMMSGIETVVFLKDFKVNEIVELNGYENGHINSKTIFTIN